MNINAIMRELAQYMRMADEIAAMVDGLRDQVKAYMAENGLDTLIGDEHKATYKSVGSSRVDTTALRKAYPDIAAQYTKHSESMRFTFV